MIISVRLAVRCYHKRDIENEEFRQDTVDMTLIRLRFVRNSLVVTPPAS